MTTRTPRNVYAKMTSLEFAQQFPVTEAVVGLKVATFSTGRVLTGKITDTDIEPSIHGARAYVRWNDGTEGTWDLIWLRRV